MASPSNIPRIICLAMQGWTAQAIARHIPCNENRAALAISLWRAEGGVPVHDRRRRQRLRVYD